MAPARQIHTPATWKKLDSPLGAALLTAALLSPFLTKAYHIDDTLFVRLAQHIRVEPLRPYNFSYAWDTQPRPFWVVTQNPPVGGYLIAGLLFLTDANQPEEWKLHGAFLAIAAACAALGYALARRFCRLPMLASAAAIVSPAFLVSASSVMSDVPMLFFFLLAVWCGVRYVESTRWWWMLAAGVAASFAAMTKYFGVAAVPLLAVYCFPTAGWRRLYVLFPLMLPVAVLAAWGHHSYRETEKLAAAVRPTGTQTTSNTQTIQPSIHPLAAAKYASQTRTAGRDSRTKEIACTLCYLGGTLLWPLFLLPLGVRLHKWGWSVAAVGIVAVALSRADWAAVRAPAVANQGTFNSSGEVIVCFGVFLAAGLFVTLLAAQSLWKRRDWKPVLLGLWYFGTLAFCVFFNWTVNARIMLPAVFPAALLVVRLIEAQRSPAMLIRWSRWSLAPVLSLSLLIALADYEFAGAARSFSRSQPMRDALRQRPVYFAGHWGFQYYMEQVGAHPVDYTDQHFRPGTLIVYPIRNSNVELVDCEPRALVFNSEKTYRNQYLVHTLSFSAHTGFYSSLSGILPFNYDAEQIADQFVVHECL